MCDAPRLRDVFWSENTTTTTTTNTKNSFREFDPLFHNAYYGFEFIDIIKPRLEQKNGLTWQEADASILFPILSSYGFYSPLLSLTIFQNTSPSVTTAPALSPTQEKMLEHEKEIWCVLQKAHARKT